MLISIVPMDSRLSLWQNFTFIPYNCIQVGSLTNLSIFLPYTMIINPYLNVRGFRCLGTYGEGLLNLEKRKLIYVLLGGKQCHEKAIF